MPLRDHFHPPLHPRRHWESFHANWAVALQRRLNRLLPEGFFAEVQVHVGGRVEVDLGTFENLDRRDATAGGNGPAGAALLAPTWVAAPPAWELPVLFPDSVEVLVLHEEGGAALVGAVEFVSPGNKDRAEARRDFVAKCSAYLQAGVGLAVIDVVTSRRANLHNELATFLGAGPAALFANDAALYAASYRPVRTADATKLQVWPEALELGRPLPDLPLALGPWGYVRLELEAAYLDACTDARIGD
jgi:hypothetical protein